MKLQATFDERRNMVCKYGTTILSVDTNGSHLEHKVCSSSNTCVIADRFSFSNFEYHIRYGTYQRYARYSIITITKHKTELPIKNAAM